MGKAQLTQVLRIAAVVLIVVLAIGLYRAKSDATKTEAHVRELRGDIAEREAHLRELRADIAEQESPANIERLTEQHLDANVGSEAQALPESALDDRLPAPHAQKARAP